MKQKELTYTKELQAILDTINFSEKCIIKGSISTRPGGRAKKHLSKFTEDEQKIYATTRIDDVKDDDLCYIYETFPQDLSIALDVTPNEAMFELYNGLKVRYADKFLRKLKYINADNKVIKVKTLKEVEDFLRKTPKLQINASTLFLRSDRVYTTKEDTLKEAIRETVETFVEYSENRKAFYNLVNGYKLKYPDRHDLIDSMVAEVNKYK